MNAASTGELKGRLLVFCNFSFTADCLEEKSLPLTVALIADSGGRTVIMSMSLKEAWLI